ncbi:hypothetical protein [endosymbiont GvMRE of Glomus versiforme]|uniref:hypothetical protein n=1 Tax=endosymbiont GvMRE of Glomus versiforme TaxID=2039283 RepID=UPI000EDDA6FF|nr:hypothetical protein [endosymbiont GvMRE of Glomus versiforme]RHZ36075.1 hypothetical protein GvMRE_Ic3g139 [endosymbiont GvMRE of Glomus versiforme]
MNYDNWTIEEPATNQGEYVLTYDQCSETIDKGEKYWICADETGELREPICQTCSQRILGDNLQGKVEGNN